MAQIKAGQDEYGTWTHPSPGRPGQIHKGGNLDSQVLCHPCLPQIPESVAGASMERITARELALPGEGNSADSLLATRFSTGYTLRLASTECLNGIQLKQEN